MLQAALELLDEVGLDDLTTRRLAAKLGVQAGALYRHFTSKQALLDAIVEHILASSQPADPGAGEWAAGVRSRAGAARAGMLAHRDGARLVATMRAPGPRATASFDAMIAAVAAAGIPAETAALAADTVFAYVNGFTIEEQARKLAGSTFTRAERDTQFAAGLELIITGIGAGLQ